MLQRFVLVHLRSISIASPRIVCTEKDVITPVSVASVGYPPAKSSNFPAAFSFDLVYSSSAVGGRSLVNTAACALLQDLNNAAQYFGVFRGTLPFETLAEKEDETELRTNRPTTNIVWLPPSGIDGRVASAEGEYMRQYDQQLKRPFHDGNVRGEDE